MQILYYPRLGWGRVPAKVVYRPLPVGVMTGYFYNTFTGWGTLYPAELPRGAPSREDPPRCAAHRGRGDPLRRPGGTEASQDPEEDPPEISPGGRSSRHGRSSVPGRRSPGPSYGPEASGTVPNTPAGIKAEDGPPEASPEAILYITRERSNNYDKPI